ncbi:unnamed protein product [marine sediment metagenome]|uniref:Rad52/22 double-strand break repair protein n=1 Tax=marine sediment metagenome TaxID=412755 RepID=X0TL12_9ZZZZ
MSDDIIFRLSEPFPEPAIRWRVGSTNAKRLGVKPWEATKGYAFAYINARDVMDRLDEVCGERWQAEYPFQGCCRIGIKIGEEWVWRSNGAGETSVEAEKGQFSDAFKRAAVLWGLGRYLYDIPNQSVPLEDGKIKAGFIPKVPDWAKPGFHRFAPSEKKEILKQVRDCLENGDGVGLKQVIDEYTGELADPEEKMKMWALFNSTERGAIKGLLTEVHQ